MALDLLAYALEFVFGPVFLLLTLPELPAVIGEFSAILGALGGEGAAALEAFLAGEYDAAGTALASLAGTAVWIALIASVLGEFGAFGDLGEAGELFELFG